MHNLHRTRRDCGVGSISYLVHAGLSGLTAEGKTFFMASMVLAVVGFMRDWGSGV